MRIVVATTAADPFAPAFWQSYFAAGGMAPEAVFFLAPADRRLNGRVVGSVLLFGPRNALSIWWSQRRLTQMLRRTPDRLFTGTKRFYHCPTLNRGIGMTSLAAERPDVFVSVGAPEIFKPAVLSIPRVGCLNVHNGRLPEYRGLFGTFWEAAKREPWGYATIHVMGRGVDEGPVLTERAVRMGRRPLMDVLMEKKRAGGQQLADLLREVSQAGRLPPDASRSNGARAGYYSWPSLRTILRFRLGRVPEHEP